MGLTAHCTSNNYTCFSLLNVHYTTLYAPHWSLHITQLYMLLTVHCTIHSSTCSLLHTVHCLAPYAPYWSLHHYTALYAPHCTLYIVQLYMLLIAHCKLHNSLCSSLITDFGTNLHAPHCSLYIKKLYMLLKPHFILYNSIWSSLITVHYTALHTPHWTLYIAQLFSQFVRVYSQNIYTRISEFLKTISTSKQIKYQISSTL